MTTKLRSWVSTVEDNEEDETVKPVKTNETRKIEALERIASALETLANTVKEDNYGVTYINVNDINQEG